MLQRAGGEEAGDVPLLCPYVQKHRDNLAYAYLYLSLLLPTLALAGSSSGRAAPSSSSPPRAPVGSAAWGWGPVADLLGLQCQDS